MATFFCLARRRLKFSVLFVSNYKIEVFFRLFFEEIRENMHRVSKFPGNITGNFLSRSRIPGNFRLYGRVRASPPQFWGSTTDLPHHLILKKISENPEFCCESKENEKSKKKSENIKPLGDGVTTRVRLFLKTPKCSFLGTFLSPNMKIFNQFCSRQVRWH